MSSCSAKVEHGYCWCVHRARRGACYSVGLEMKLFSLHAQNMALSSSRLFVVELSFVGNLLDLDEL